MQERLDYWPGFGETGKGRQTAQQRACQQSKRKSRQAKHRFHKQLSPIRLCPKNYLCPIPRKSPLRLLPKLQIIVEKAICSLIAQNSSK